MRIAFRTAPRCVMGAGIAVFVAVLGAGQPAGSAEKPPPAKATPAAAKPVAATPAKPAAAVSAPTVLATEIPATPAKPEASVKPTAAPAAAAVPAKAAAATPPEPPAPERGPAVAETPAVSPVESPATSHSGIELRALTEEARQYCVNIRDAAVDARIAWQTATLRDLEKQVESQVAALEAKRAEYEMWLRKREEFLQRAREDIVAIYARMRPDAAAGQLATMDEETAVAVLAKLNARNAGAILNEMEPARAAQLANRLAGVSGLSMKGEKL